MIHLDANCLMESQLARSMGLDKYADIMEAARKRDVSSDAAFQHAFNAFYRVRRNAEYDVSAPTEYWFLRMVVPISSNTSGMPSSLNSFTAYSVQPCLPMVSQFTYLPTTTLSIGWS